MLRPLYEVLPGPVHKLISLEVRAFRQARDGRIRDGVPKTELAERHIANLKVLTDRRALVETLPKEAVVAEIGVARGDFSQEILEISRPTQLHLIDWWRRPREYRDLRDAVEQRFANEIAEGRVIIHQGSSVSELAKFDGGYFDWVYIDSAHDYKTTAAELALCREKVRLGGFIAGHDYTVGFWDLDLHYGVIEAVNEFCVQHEWEMAYLSNEASRNLSYALTQSGV